MVFMATPFCTSSVRLRPAIPGWDGTHKPHDTDEVGSPLTGMRNSREAASETVENNTRKLIIDERPINPKYYDKMSDLLDALIKQRRQNAIEYKDYLEKLTDLAKQVVHPESAHTYPPAIDSAAKRALFDNADENEHAAVAIDAAIRNTRKDSWRGNRVKEREVRNAIRLAIESLDPAVDLNVDLILELAKNQDEY
jgi:type I restriction enzyme, R subunit